MSALAKPETDTELVIEDVSMPVLALLISGGHTELVLMKEWLSYELVGQTRDDAVGEAFDKVARMLELPYPGGPEISKIAELLRGEPDSEFDTTYALPRPMIHEPNCDFSFSGLKTAVLTLLKKNPDLTERQKQTIAREFEDAVGDVLSKKTSHALDTTAAQTLVLGGGVSANTHIRRVFSKEIALSHPSASLRIPPASLTTDNAIMIALAGFYHAARNEFAESETLLASGTRSLS